MNKLAEIQNKLHAYDVDDLFVTNPINRRYITNFTGTAGFALITISDAFFMTDFRYVDQAKKQAKDFTVLQHHGPIEDELSKLLKKLAIKRLGFEEEHVTYRQYTLFKKKLSPQLVAVNGIIEKLRMIKSNEELSILKKAAKIADDAFEYILNVIKPGIKEIEVANELEFFMRRNGATSSSFDIIVASGVRSALPHGVASEKVINNGELVTLDFGALYKGYCSDITRTIAIGPIDETLKEIYDIVLKAQTLALSKIKPGMTGQEADAFARDVIDEAGYG